MNNSLLKLRVPGALLAIAFGVISATAQPTAQWDFDNGNLNGTVGTALTPKGAEAAQFGTTTSFSIPDIGGQPANVMRFPASVDASGGYSATFTAPPNGGGTFVNEWTLLMDVLFPAASSSKLRALVETDLGTLGNNDADIFVRADNRLGSKAAGFGTIAADTWHRVGIVVAVTAGAAGELRFYVDGAQVGVIGVPNLTDQRYALNGQIEFFTDDDGETQLGYVNSIQLRDVALGKGQMSALGGPTAAGLPQALPPVSSFIEKWIPAGQFAGRTAPVGVVVDPGSTTIQDSSISLLLDNQALATPTITRANGLITVQKDAGTLAIGEHTLILRYTDSLAGAKSFTNKFTSALFYEDFEGLALAGAKDETGGATAFEQGWTNRPPVGWSIDNSLFPAVQITDENPDGDGDGYADADGITEWAGWSFARKEFWVASDNQTRDQFSLGQGTLAIADPDEWDDTSHFVSLFNSFLKTPPISLTGVAPNTAFLAFASSWRPEGFDDPGANFPQGPNGPTNNQTAIITVSYNGGAPIQVLKYDSLSSSPTYKPDSQNESVLLALNNPASATNMIITFALIDSANDWWWAIDNVVVNAGASAPIISQQPVSVEVVEGQAASLSVVASGSGATYQWYKGHGSGKAPIIGATSASFLLPAAQVENYGYYSVVISNSVGSVTSSTAKVGILPKADGRVVLLTENFNSLALGPNVDETTAGDAVWTKTPPAGWSIDDTGVPGVGTDQDGVTEWAGWSFADRSWWATVGGQNRDAFTRATGAAAIADSDEWDDVGHAAGNMATYLKVKSVPLQGLKANSLVLQFDSSWNPESPQKANITVAFDGGVATEIFRYESETTSPNFHPTEFSETIALRINNPAGAQNAVITFGYFETRNNWWYAIDNLVVMGEVAAVGLNDGLVAHLKFDNDLADSSGRGNNGTNVGTPGFAAGKVGSGALVFTSRKDGTSFNYVTLGNPADLDFGSSTSFSVSFWAKLTVWEGDPSFLANKNWNSGGNPGWVIATAGDGHIQWNLAGTAAGASGDRKDFDGAAGTFTGGQWRHIVMTFDRAGMAVTYVDGVKVNEQAISTPPNNLTTPAGLATNIGQDGVGTYTDGNSVSVTDGMIDDVGIWRRALTASEVTKIYTLGSAGQDFESKLITDDLVVHMTFDGNLNDSSGRANNGTGVGNPGFAAGKLGSGALVVTSKKDGSSFNYVTLGNPTDLNFGTNVNFSVSFWGKLTAWEGDPSFLANKNWNSGNNPGWVIATAGDGHIQWNLAGTAAGASGDRKDFDGAAGTFTGGQWRHIVMTFDRAGMAVTYVDGVKVDERAISTPVNDLTTPAGLATNIGQDGVGTYTDGNSVSVTDGMIDDVGIWRRVLSASEVATIFQNAAQGLNLAGQGGPAGSGLEIASVQDLGNALRIGWEGGAAPYLIQMKSSLSDTNWINLLNTSETSAVVPKSGGNGFYRVVNGLQANPSLFTAWLNGANEKPTAVATPGRGMAIVSVEGNTATLDLYYGGLSSATTAAHFHGPTNSLGSTGVLVGIPDLSVGPLASSSRFYGTVTLTDTQRAAIVGGLTYLNIHTAVNTGGEIRGQVAPFALQASLSGANERPDPVTSAGTGTGKFWLSGNQLFVNLSYTGLSGPATAAHIHGRASVDAGGPIMIDMQPLHVGAFGAAGTFTGSVFVTNPDHLGALIDGQSYFNIHTTAIAGGEIRGQIVP